MAAAIEAPNPFDRRGLADAGFTVALVGLGAYGFRTSFGGWQFLVVGVVAAAIGIGAAAAVIRYRFPAVVAAAIAIVTLVVLGGIATPDSALLGILPGPSTFSDLADGAANGWARLLTSSAPAGTEGNVLVVPYLCAFAGAFLSMLLARRRSAVPWCVLPPMVVLVASVLLGIKTPANLLLQGGVFAAVGIAWVSARVELRQTQIVGGTGAGRPMAAVAMLGAVLVLSTNVAPHLPGAPPSSSDRVILRDDVIPPFDARDYASPLVGYRKFLIEPVKDRPLFEVSGLPEKGLIRVAVMDYFDGIVWSVAPPVDARSLGSAGVFRHVGPVIPDAPTEGERVQVRIVADQDAGSLPTGVWVPTVGAATSVRFTGPRAEELQKSYRFNRATDIVATPLGLVAGDGVELTGVIDSTTVRSLDARPTTGEFRGGDPGGLGPNTLPDPLVQDIRTQIEAVGTDGAERALALEELFQANWYYDPDGLFKIAPGHSLAHLRNFLETRVQDKTVGNAEQYAAMMAVAARMLGMPARVVVGFEPKHLSDGAGVVTGDEAEAWVEINFEGIGWVPYFPTPDRDNTTQDEPQPVLINEVQTEEAKTAVTTPPPRIVNLDNPRTDKGEPDEESSTGFLIRWLVMLAKVVGLAAVTVASPMALLALAKGQRRRRRRHRGQPARRISAGFVEALDAARDAGRPVPGDLTRAEAAQLIGDPSLTALAATVDLRIFGPGDPSDADADQVWAQVDGYRKEQVAGRSLLGKVRFHGNPTSLIGGWIPADSFAGARGFVTRLPQIRLRPRSAP